MNKNNNSNKNIKEFQFLEEYEALEQRVTLLNNNVKKGILPTSFILENILKEVIKEEKLIISKIKEVKEQIKNTDSERDKEVLTLSLDRLMVYKNNIPNIKKKLDLFLTLVSNKQNINENEIQAIINVYDIDNDWEISLTEEKLLEKNIAFLETFKKNPLFKDFFTNNKIEFNNKDISDVVKFFKTKRNLIQHVNYLKELYSDVISYFSNLNINTQKLFLISNNFNKEYENIIRKDITNYNKINKVLDQKLDKISWDIDELNKIKNNIKKIDFSIKEYSDIVKDLRLYLDISEYNNIVKRMKKDKTNLFSEFKKEGLTTNTLLKLNNLKENFKQKVREVWKRLKEEKKLREKEKKKKNVYDEMVYLRNEINNKKVNSNNENINELLDFWSWVLTGWSLDELLDRKDYLSNIYNNINTSSNDNIFNDNSWISSSDNNDWWNSSSNDNSSSFNLLDSFNDNSWISSSNNDDDNNWWDNSSNGDNNDSVFDWGDSFSNNGWTSSWDDNW